MEPLASWRGRLTWPEPQLTPQLPEVWWLPRNSCPSPGILPASSSSPSTSSVLKEFVQAAFGCGDGPRHNLLPSSPYMPLLPTFSRRSVCCTPALALYVLPDRVAFPFFWNLNTKGGGGAQLLSNSLSQTHGGSWQNPGLTLTWPTISQKQRR